MRNTRKVKNGFGKGQKRVLNGIKKESRQIRESGKGKNGPAASFHIFPTDFSTFRPFFHPFFTISVKKGKRLPKIEERERKEKRSFLFPSHSVFYLSFLGTSLLCVGARQSVTVVK